MKITAHGDSHIGRIRQTNEDYFLQETIGEEEELFVVADGMGGHQAGDVASRLGARSFAASYKRLRRQGKPVVDALTQSLRKANAVILRKAQLDPRKKGMGTTFSAAVVAQGRLHVIHVGDSRVYLVRGGAIRRLTTDQTFVAKMVEDGRITEEEARDHPQKNILYMSLGAREHFTPEIISDLELAEGDILVLCSDGLNTHVTDEVIRAYAESYYPREAVAGLIRRANESGGVDNITVQVVRVGPVGDLDNTVVLQRADKSRRFPWLWLAATAVLLGGLLLFFPPWRTDRTNGKGGDGALHSRAALEPVLPLPSRRLVMTPLTLPPEADTLLRADPRHLVHFSRGKVWLFAGDRYLVVSLDSSRKIESVTLPNADRLVPNPANRRLLLRRIHSRLVRYSLHEREDGEAVLYLQADNAMDGIDQRSRTISLYRLTPPVQPVFIDREYFVFATESTFCMVENPLLPRKPLHLRKCRFNGDGLPEVFSLRLVGRDMVLLAFVPGDRQLEICRMAPGGEPASSVVPYAFFRDPLGVEYLPDGAVMAYFPDGATRLEGPGTNGETAFSADPEKGRLVRIAVAPASADRLAVTEAGVLYRVGFE